jgi:D-alanyl-D-alanine carboxypeptidase
MMAALEFDDFNKIYSTSHYTVPATNMSEPRELYTTVNLIRTENKDWYYDERYIGGKTGFTTPAGRCLVTVSESEDGAFKMLSVVLGAEATIHDDGYTILEYGHFEETEDMVDHTCYNYMMLDVYARGQTLDMFQVSGGENSVAAEPDKNMAVMVPDDYKDSEINLRTEVVPGGLSAPVNVGDEIGTLRVWYRDICVSQTDLLSMSVSKKDTMTSIFSGGVLTEEEDQKLTGTFHVVAKWFVLIVAVVAALALIVAVYNGVTEFQRRKRRRNRSRNRRRSR